MDQNPVYGRQSKMGQTLIKEVIRIMLEQGYLRQTQDKYSLLKLTEKSEQLLEQEERFMISYKKEEEKKKGSGKSGAGKRSAQMEELTGERSVPPYVVASDKALRDMCSKLPLTENEMLDVNGMGAKKMEQYGGQFLEKIREVTGGDRETWDPDKGIDESRESL